MKVKPPHIPLPNFFAETLTDMKKSRRRCTPEYDLRDGDGDGNTSASVSTCCTCW